ncbi:MAG: molecular chaperone HtpG [Acidobacteriota bacterium]|nr:molecular chaperone HtpG [Acidobacteriota bacterium]
MAEFADLISNLLLYQELDHTADRDSIGATDVARLKGLVNDVADTAGPAMAQIPVTFRQYTVHDIHHCRNVIDLMGKILPAETREKLNALEITCLLLSALLHDVGMVVSDSEKAETLLSGDFRRFRAEDRADRNKAIEESRADHNEPRAQAIEDALLAEYYRRLHPERVRQFMDRHLAGRLKYREIDLADDLARLCESHAWGVEESNDARHPEKAVARLDDNVRLYGVRVNLQYLACILRLADILDFDRSRTPLTVFQHLDFSEPKSWDEWNKHLQVKGYEITPTQVAFDIPCTRPVFYVAVHEFLDWIDDELRQCRYLVENKPQITADRYKLLLPQVVDRHKVRMADPCYVAGAFRFQLEYENILALLMDKSLYPDPSLFLRELLQNALDACRRKEADMEIKGLTYRPRIVVWDRTSDPSDPRVVFQDNGIGMSQRIVEQYFLRVGRSYYRSPEFDTERQRLRERGKDLDACSQFGIGILSCFLVGDRFEVETHQEGYDPLHIQIEGPSKYFVVKRLTRPESSLLYQKPSSDEGDGPPKRSGTRITVHFRPEVEVDVWQTLDTFAVNTDYPIVTHRMGRKKPRIIQALRWERPVHVQDFPFRMSYSRCKIPTLEDALISSLIPFSRWDFSSHIRGSSWFWLLRGPDGQPTPRSGFLKVGTRLEFVGVADIVKQMDSLNGRDGKDSFSYSEWIEKLESEDVDFNEPDESELFEYWLRLSEEERELAVEVTNRRSRILASGRLRSWVSRHEDVRAFLRGSIEWADQPLTLTPVASTRALLYSLIRPKELEDLIALHSILLPAGIVEWSPLMATSERIGLLPFFGGVRVDIRGAQAPRPAAHRLFVPKAEARDFRRRYLHATLLHGAELVAQYGRRNKIWRRWFCELVEATAGLGLNQDVFVRAHGQRIEDACGLAVRMNQETVYLSRAETRELIPGPIYFRNSREEGQYLLWTDPVNNLLSDVGDDFRWDARVEVDLSDLPIVRAEKGTRTGRSKRKGDRVS